MKKTKDTDHGASYMRGSLMLMLEITREEAKRGDSTARTFLEDVMIKTKRMIDSLPVSTIELISKDDTSTK